MKTILTSLALMLGSISFAQAEEFTCSFTEPFYTIYFTTSTGTVTIHNDMENTDTKLEGIDLWIAGPGKFRWVDKDGNSIADLVMDFNGSDGMGDEVFAYSIKTDLFGKGANNGVGGCASSLFPVKGE